MFKVVSGWYLVYCDKCGNLCNDCTPKDEFSIDLCEECLRESEDDDPPLYDENWTPDFL